MLPTHDNSQSNNMEKRLVSSIIPRSKFSKRERLVSSILPAKHLGGVSFERTSPRKSLFTNKALDGPNQFNTPVYEPNFEYGKKKLSLLNMPFKTRKHPRVKKEAEAECYRRVNGNISSSISNKCGFPSFDKSNLKL